ncbi:SCN10A [Symbiodinium natans]|uniref:SCN10A protein n=1 Tax=Symbiodinium natans TaxID=878477 RepID=A0A812JBL5_9DINO|nr:SCN10A [Symbiodinium natans]
MGGGFAAAMQRMRQGRSSSIGRSDRTVSSPSTRGDTPNRKPTVVMSDFIRVQQPSVNSQDNTFQHKVKDKIRKIVTGRVVSNFMAAVVLFDAFCTCSDVDARAAGLETPQWMLTVSDFCLALYTIELGLLLYVQGRQLLKDWMVILDIVIIFCGYAELLLNLFAPGDLIASFSMLRVLRLARIIRLMRLLRRTRALRELQKLVTMMATCLKALAWSFIFCFVIMTIWAMLLVEIVHPIMKEMRDNEVAFQDCEKCLSATSSVMNSNLLLFQTVIAGDSWGDIAVPVIEFSPGTAIIFVGSLLTLVFGVLNLIVAVVVDTFAEVRQRDVLNLAEEMEHEIESDKKFLQKIFERIDTDGSGRVTLEELVEGARKDPQFQSRLRVMDIDEADLQQLFEMIDIHSEGEIEAAEFIAPLSRWVHESTTAPRFIKYNMLRTIQMQEELQEATHMQFDHLASRIDQIAHVLHHVARESVRTDHHFGPTASSKTQPRTLGKDPLPADEPANDPEVDVPRYPTRDSRVSQESPATETALSPNIHMAMLDLEQLVLSATESALRKSMMALESTVKECWLEAYRPERGRNSQISVAVSLGYERSASSTKSGRGYLARAGSAESVVKSTSSMKSRSRNAMGVPIGSFAPPASGPPMQRVHSEKAEERIQKHYSMLQFTAEADERYYEPSDQGEASRQTTTYAEAQSKETRQPMAKPCGDMEI